MKKPLLITLTALLLVLSTSNTWAVSDAALGAQERAMEKKEAANARLEEHRLLKDQRLTDLKQRMEDKRATRAAQLDERKKERISSFFDRMIRRLEAVIARLDTLIERIEARLAKIEENNEEIDTSVIQADIETAKALLAQSSADLEAASESFDAVLEADDPKAAFSVIRETIQGIRDNLKEVHRLLVSVIGDIKGLRVGQTTDVEEATDSASP